MYILYAYTDWIPKQLKGLIKGCWDRSSNTHTHIRTHTHARTHTHTHVHTRLLAGMHANERSHAYSS